MKWAACRGAGSITCLSGRRGVPVITRTWHPWRHGNRFPPALLHLMPRSCSWTISSSKKWASGALYLQLCPYAKS